MTDLIQLKALVVRYVLGEDDPDAFRDQFAAATAEVNFNDAPPELVGLVDTVDALLVRRDLGEITDAEFERALREAVTTTHISMDTEVFTVAGTIRHESSIERIIKRTTNATLVDAS